MTPSTPSPSKTAVRRRRRPANVVPRGRDEVVEAIIDATLSAWVAEGAESLSLRKIADRAGVNYGLVHRHFGTRDAVIRAAMNRASARSYDLISEMTTLWDALDVIVAAPVGAFARLMGWVMLQHDNTSVLPTEYPFILHICELAAAETGGVFSADSREVRVFVGTVMVTLFGSKLFAPYLQRSLQLDGLERNDLRAAIEAQLHALTSAKPARRAPASKLRK